MSQKDPCQKQACAIQKCLKANNYIESRCEDVIQAMRKCCEVHRAVESVCCSGFAKQFKVAEGKTFSRDMKGNPEHSQKEIFTVMRLLK